MKQLLTLSAHESCCNVLNKEITKNCSIFIQRCTLLVSFHRNATVNKSDKYLQVPHALILAVPQKNELSQKNYSHL